MQNKGASVYAKVRTRFGERLKANDFAALADLKTVSEIAEYLKSTKYAPAVNLLGGKADLRRAELESAIYIYSLKDSYSLCKYDSALGDSISFLLMQREEILELLSFLRYLKAGRPEEYILSLSLMKDRIAEIDLTALAKVKTASELAVFLKDTRYYKYIGSLLTENFDYTVIELALYKAYYLSAERRIKKAIPEGAKDILSLLFLKAEANDVSTYYRVLKYYPEDLLKVQPFLIKKPALLKKAVAEKLYSTSSLNEFISLLESTKYNYSSTTKLLINRVIHNIHFKSDAFLVLLSYVYYTEEEQKALVKIIEGVRYGLPPAEILGNIDLYKLAERSGG